MASAGLALMVRERVRDFRKRAGTSGAETDIQDSIQTEWQGVRRGALSVLQAIRRTGALQNGQRISAATCKQIRRVPGGV